MVNLMAIMTDKEHWKYPDTFNPENFLDEKGQFCKNDAFLPFSLGESAAGVYLKIQVHLYEYQLCR